MSKYTYSVIIPCYDATEKDFRRCLNSIKNQTVQPLEVICVDDCSPVETPQIAKEYGYTYIRHTKNLNNGGARNTGMRAAAGDYLIFVNSDDWIKPETIEEVNKVNKGEDMIVIGFQSFGAYDYGFTPDKNTAIKMHSLGWNGEPMHIVNRKFILDNKLFEEEHVDIADPKWCKDLEENIKTYTFVPKRLYMYQVGHSSSIMTKVNTVNYSQPHVKVMATNKYKEKHILDAILNRIPKEGEIWLCETQRAKMLAGDNQYKTKFVQILEIPKE